MRHTRIIVTHYGGPEALRVVEEECPEPKPGEVRVRVLAAGRTVKISEHFVLLAVTGHTRVSRADPYRDSYQCQIKLRAADRQPFRRTADLAKRADHWQE